MIKENTVRGKALATRLSEIAKTWKQCSNAQLILRGQKGKHLCFLSQMVNFCDLQNINFLHVDLVSYFHFLDFGRKCIAVKWFQSKYLKIWPFGLAFSERPGPSVKGPASLWEALPLFQRPCLSVNILVLSWSRDLTVNLFFGCSRSWA